MIIAVGAVFGFLEVFVKKPVGRVLLIRATDISVAAPDRKC